MADALVKKDSLEEEQMKNMRRISCAHILYKVLGDIHVILSARDMGLYMQGQLNPPHINTQFQSNKTGDPI